MKNHIQKALYALVPLFLFSAHLFAEEEIFVRLETQASLIPIMICPIEAASSDLAQTHVKTLSSLFRSDMNHNGMTKTASLKELEAACSGFDSPVDFEKLKNNDIFYLIKMKIEGKNCITKVISINGKSVKLIDGISLTGELNQDRKTIHLLADTIYEVLFQKKGIASQHILFSIREKKESPDKAPDWESSLYECDTDGANLKKLTFDSSYCVTPLFTQLANDPTLACYIWVAYKNGQPKIYYAPTKDGKARRLTPLRGNQVTPGISPDGTKLAFSCDTMGSADLFLVSFHPHQGALGKPRQIFTWKGTTAASPTFSPDSNQIAFVANMDGSPKIYTMEIPPDGATSKDLHPELISKRCRENSSPAWSPDGKKIAYSAKCGSWRQIWIYDLTTYEERQLTDGPGHKENPAWAPDSLHLVFNAQRGDTSELYLINLNQRESTKISSGGGEKRFPYWK